MKVAILSDIHDNVWTLAEALEFIEGEADAMICCGDLCSPFIINQLAEGFAGPIHIVFGNNDGDLYRITHLAAGHEHVHLHGEAFFGEIGGEQFGVNHFPEIASAMARSGNLDVVCYGHNHSLQVETVGHTLLINPGAIMGFHPGSGEDIPATFVMYDTESAEVQAYEVLEDDVEEIE